MTFIPIGVELLSYYMAFIIAVALLYEKREEVGTWLLLATAFTQFVAWAPLRNMSRELDEQHTLFSFGTVVAFGAILWLFRDQQTWASLVERLRRRRVSPAGPARAGPAPAEPPQAEPPQASAVKPAPGAPARKKKRR